jgi:ribosome maturation factor RimP
MQQPTPTSTKAGIDLDRIRAALAPVLARHGVSLVDVEWLTERAGWTLRLTIEREGAADLPSDPSNPSNPSKPQLESGGVTLEDCAEVSKDASAVLDAEDFIPQHYMLEVSSPGLDRKLRTPAEFERFAGKTVKVKLSRPAPDGQRLLRGTLERAEPGKVAVTVDGKRIEALFDDVVEARLVYELETQPKPKPGTRPGQAGKASQMGKASQASKGKSGAKEPPGSKRR